MSASTGRPQRRPTLNDVAALAGVSKSLVSLVMQGSPKVSDHRRAAVWRAAAQLGYQPNAVARSLVQQRTHLVGVLGYLGNPLVAEVIEGIDDRLVELGYQLVLGGGSRRPERQEELLTAFARLRVDGVIVHVPVLPQAALRRAAAMQPLVVLCRPELRLAGVDTVVNDEAEGMRLAMDHLVALRHQGIAHIAGDGSSALERRRAYEQAMRDRDLARHIRVVAGSYEEQGGYDGARTLLDDPTPPTAIIAANDVAATGALTAIAEAGLRVPDDISVVGYDDSDLAALRRISLTSVAQPGERMGRLAAEMLDERIESGRTRARRRVVRPTLAVRRSTGPASQHAVA